MHTLKLLLLFGWICFFSCAQRPVEPAAKTKWMTLQEVEESLKKENRPVLIDLYTDWCGWCKVMDRKTYSNKQVSEYLGKKFYAVKVDAETRNELAWKGKKYTFNPNYKANNFAVYLTQGQLSFPTTVIIPPGGDPQAIPGYLPPADFELIVKYFGEDKFGKVPFDQYQQGFKSSW